MAGPAMRPATATPPALSGWKAATASLRYTQFRWIFASNMAFFFAMNGQFVVRSVLAFRLTESPFALGAVNLAFALPMLVVSPFGGVVADRIERRKLILIGQGALLASEFVVLGLLISGHLAFWHLMAVVFLMGNIFPFIMPARQAIVANLVGREGLPNAMALQMSGMNANRIIAPVLAGFLIYLLGINAAYAVSVALFGVAFLAITRIRRAPPIAPDVKKSVFTDLLDGVKYVKNDRPVAALILLSIVPIALAMPFQTLLVVFADDVWNVGERGLGIMQAAAGIGGVVGSVYVAWHGRFRLYQKVLLSSILGFAGTLFLFAMSPWFLLALPLLLIADVFVAVFTTVNSTVVQLIIPDQVRGRVMSLMMMTFGLTPLGTVPVSAAAELWGAPAAVGGAALLTCVIAGLFFVFSPALRSIDRVVQERSDVESATHRAAIVPAVEREGEREPVGATGS
jgi:MFS family permease